MQTAQQLAAELGRPVLWTLPPTGHKDVRAWVLAEDLDPTVADEWCVAGDELEAALVRAAKPPDPAVLFEGPPQPLDASPAPPAFPVEVLPEVLQAFVREAAAALNCPADFVGVPLLVLAGAALGNAWRLRLTASHEQSAALFAAIVGAPGSAKSPALALVAEPLHAANGAWLGEYERQREHDEGLGVKNTPPPRRCLVDDFTTEGLAPILQANPKGVAVVKDELAGLIHGLNQYKGGKGNDRQALLAMWAGASVVIDRKTGPGPIHLANPFVAIVGGIQPAVLDTLRTRNRQAVVDDGLLDRFLFCYPVVS
jgi:hypothetical protein